MHFLHFFLVVLPLLLGIHADVLESAGSTPAIVSHLEEIQELTIEMASMVQNWDGDVVTSVPITIASDSIIKAIESGTETATNSKKMSVSKAIKVKRATKNLLKAIESSLGTVASKKALFDHAGLTSTMISRLKDSKGAAATLNGAIVEKLPKVGKKVGEKLGRKIVAAFDSAIAHFSDEVEKDPKEALI
ncbi:hypothetical protein DHEL01_v203724 [Diaporthe helianthi]|uniref:Cell wall protein n=1 Tax=Diaporthe helianthi TaxID=158607 RepID=A0A2P5I5W2_DIAHE|nr:hypothetical protein DHEL01_v203724 [Diaporthe helianthi]